MATRKKTAARPILSLDDLDAAGIGLGWQPMVPAQEVAPVAPVEQEQDGPMARGVKQVSASVGLAGRLAARDFDGAAKNISDQAAYRAANPGSEEAQGLRRAWQQGDGIWGGIKGVAGEFADDYKRADGVGAGVMSVGRNLQAMGSSLVEQVPNMALPMAGMIGGGAAGSAAAGPIGTVAGGWAGASAGNALVGTSEAAFRQLEKAGVNPTDAAAVREYLAKNGDAILGETAIKGGVIGAVDVATAGLAHWLLSGPGKMATTKALTEMGVDMADKAAVKAATKTPVFKNLIANDATYQATQVGAQKLLRNTGAAATEPVGEFAGEYGGSLAATGEADAKDAFLEAASSLGQSGIMFAGQKAIQAIKSPSQAAADQIRATEKVPESGALTKAMNAGVEAKAQAVEAGGLQLAPLVVEQTATAPNDLALEPLPGESAPEPVDDPVRDQILALPDGARQDALRAYAVVNRTDVAKGVQQYNRKLLDRLLAENAPPPVLGERLTDTDMGSMLGGGGMAGRADPLAGALGMNNDAQAAAITNVANVAERRPPMPASDAARMLDEARNRGLDLAVAEHPAGGFVLVPPNWVTPDMAAQGEARLNETIARMQQADAAPVERAPRTRTDGVGLDLQTDPVQNYLDNLRGVNTPAARAYVRDFDAGRITPADVQQRMQAEKGKTPDQRIAQAAAEAPAQTDPVADRLARAAAQGMATPAPTDILNPAGEPFKTRMAADRAAKKTPGAVVPVEGGFVVRPQEPVNVQDVPQAPEVPQAAPAISQPGQAPQAVGAQPAGPAAGVPAEGAGAVEAAGLTENKVGRKDSAQIAQPESVVGDTSPPWASMTPDQRRRTLLEQEIATGMTNNGGVMAKLRPSAIEKRKQELAAMPPKEAAGSAPNSGVIPAVPAAPAAPASQAQEATKNVAISSNGQDEKAIRYELPPEKYAQQQGNESWMAAQSPSFKPTARQQLLMDAVAKALDDGAFYNSDVDEHVAKALGVTLEQRARNSRGVEGGDFGYDVYGARKAVEAQRSNAKSREFANALNLKPGDALGTLIFNDGKVTTGVKVNGLNDSGLVVTVTGKRGAATLNGEVGIDRLAAAMDKAKERGKRKDGYAEFVAGRGAVQPSPQDFIPAPDGGLDYGEITPEMGKAMRRQAGKIRLQHGVQNSNGTGWGLVHIEANHGKQISGLGFGSVQDFVAHVASSIQQVWQVPGNSQLLLTLKDGRKDVMYIQLEIAKEGDFYRVNSAFPVRQEDYESLKGMKKIWDGSEPTSAVTGQRPAFATAASASPESESSQGSSNARGQDASVPPVAPAAQPDTPKLTPSEAKSLMAWEDLGQKDGVKTHALTFYESQADKDAKRGRMIVAKVSKGDRSATAWMVDGEDKTFGALAQAKKLAEEVGMAKAVADGFVEPAAEKPAAAAKPAATATTSAPIEDAGEKIGGARKDQEDGAKEREAAKSAKRRAERAKDSTETGLRVGIAPGSADPVTVRDGTVYVGKYEAVNYDTGEPVTVPKGSTGEAVAQALKDAGALSSRQRLFGLGEMGNAVMFSFAGQRAATADKHALASAQKRLAAGEDPEAVRQDTGWFKGTDGKWRFEINDADAKLLKEPSDPSVYADIFDEAASRSNGVPLGKVLDHPALFAAYPALKATRFIVDDQYGGNGSYSADENAIRVRDPYSYKNGPDQLLSVLLHEIQHGIQNIEGFATGGNQDSRADVMQAVSQQRTLWADVYAVRRELDAGKKLDTVLEEWQEFLDAQPSAEALRIAQDPELETSVALQNMETLERQYAQLRNEGRGDTYRRLAGEVEARNTQARQGMTDEQRRATPPSQTADVADSRVIVMFNGEEMQNAPAPVNAEQSLAYAKQQLGTPVDPYQHKLQAIQAARKQAADVVQADNGQWLLAPKAEPYTAQEARDAQQRIDKLNRALKKYNNVTPAAVLSDAPTPAMAWGRSIARTLGYNVTFIQPNPDFHGVAVGGDAFVSASADHPEIGLIGHEVLHSFKQSDPDTYEALAERIRPYLKDGVVDAKRRWEDANGGRNTSMAHAEEEVLADLNGAMWLDPKFWREMAKNDQSLFRQVAYKFMEVATKAMQGLSRFKADSLVTDVDAVRKIIAQEWAYQAQEMGNPSEFAASDSPAFSRTTAQSIASSMGDMTPDQEKAYKNVAGVKAVPTVRERMDALKANLGLKLRQGLVDQFAAIKQLDQNAYVQARMSKGTDGTLEAMLMYGKPFMRDGAPDVDVKDGGFAKVLASLKGEQDRWMMWIAAQRAEKLKAEGKENLMTDDDISALKTLNAGKMADGTARSPVYAKALQELNAYNDAMLKLAMDSGLIDKDAYDLMAGQPYVPFYRLMEEGDMKGPKFSSGLVNQKAWQKLKGGTQQLNADLLQNMLLNWSHLLQASAKNRAATATMDAAEKMAVAYKVAADTKGAVKVMRDGSAEHWMVEDPYLLDAISAIHYVPSPLMKPLAKFKQLLTWGVTVNPTFKIRNLIRDSVSAIAQSELGYNPGANVAKGWKLTAKDSQIYASMLASGGLIKFGTQENTDRLRAQVAKLGGVVLDKSGTERFFGQIKDLYDVYNEFGDRAENVNRAALYDALIKKGKTHAEAAFMARDLMDFSMSGSAPVVRFLTQAVPFLNARLVGLDKLGRAAMEDPRRFVAVTGAVALASLALLAAYSDDDDWKKREDWDRDAYWWFKVGDQAYRIPKPFEVGAIGTLAERTAELMLSDEMTGKRYMERVSHMLSGTFSFNPVPQAFKPLLDLYANKDSFTGRAIESQADQRLRPQDRYSERTPEVAKFLGGLGLPDPAQLVKGEYSALSPKQVEHLIRGYFSWVGTAAMTVSDFGLRPLAGRGERPDMRLKDVFIAGNFVENLPTGSSRYVTQMYEQSRQVEQAYASYQEAIKAGDTEKAQSIKESAGPLLRNRPAYTAATRQLAEINRTAKRIEADQAMAGAAKRARLTQLEQQRQVIAQRVSRLAAATP